MHGIVSQCPFFTCYLTANRRWSTNWTNIDCLPEIDKPAHLSLSCTLIDKNNSPNSYGKGMFGRRYVEFLYAKHLTNKDYDSYWFEMISSIINNVVKRPNKIMKFNKVLNTRVTIIALDGFISQGKTTDLNNRILENGPLKNNEYIIREQDYEWRGRLEGQNNYMIKNHQNLLIFHLLADIYQIYIKQGTKNFFYHIIFLSLLIII